MEANPNTISGKILIPTECGGLIIGRGGITIRSIQEESGARVQVTSKDNPESKISRERILTLSGLLSRSSPSLPSPADDPIRDTGCLYQRLTACSSKDAGGPELHLSK
jgi:hypothetical protein